MIIKKTTYLRTVSFTPEEFTMLVLNNPDDDEIIEGRNKEYNVFLGTTTVGAAKVNHRTRRSQNGTKCIIVDVS